MKDENYINIQGWMINKLKLKGNELILYALIYGYSQDGKNKFRGSINYIMEALKISNRGVINLISKLIEKKLIEKYIKTTGNEYKAVVKKLHSEKSSQVKKVHSKPVNKVHTQVVNKVPKSSEKSSHNNNRYNNNNNNNIILHSKQSLHGKKINQLITLFEPLNPNYEKLFKNKTQRKALEDLVKKFTYRKIFDMLACLPELMNKRYCPVITTPLELEKKLGALISFVKKEEGEENNKYQAKNIEIDNY